MIRLKDWMRKSSIKFFARNTDIISASGYLALANKMVADVASRGYEVVCRDTFFIHVRARQILSNNLRAAVFREDEIFGAEAKLDEHFERVHEWFDTRIQQAEQKLDAGGKSKEYVQSQCRNYETRTVSLSVTKYLDILAKADHYVTLVNYLWMIGELADSAADTASDAMRAKLKIEGEVRQTLFNITRASTKHYNNIRTICNEAIEQRKKGREAQAERDRQKAATRMPKKAGKAAAAIVGENHAGEAAAAAEPGTEAVAAVEAAEADGAYTGLQGGTAGNSDSGK